MKGYKRWLAGLCAAAMLWCPVGADPIIDVESGETFEELTGMEQAEWEAMTGGALSADATAPEIGGGGAILISLSGGEVLFE